MKLSVVIKGIFKLTAVFACAHVMASQNIQKDIDNIKFNLKSDQIYTIKNYSNGQFKELAFTRIERPKLVVDIKRSNKNESFEVELQESLLTAKTGLLNIKLNDSGLANLTSESNSKTSKINVLSKVRKGSIKLRTKEAAKILKNDIIANVNRIVTKIGFRDQTKLNYHIKNISLNCPKLSGRITNCRGQYEIEATISNEVKKEDKSNLVKLLSQAKHSFKSLGTEIEINAYISELRSINKQLNKLGKTEGKNSDLQKLYSLKKDVQSEILDSYQYTAISSSSAISFIDGLDKKVRN